MFIKIILYKIIIIIIYIYIIKIWFLFLFCRVVMEWRLLGLVRRLNRECGNHWMGAWRIRCNWRCERKQCRVEGIENGAKTAQAVVCVVCSVEEMERSRRWRRLCSVRWRWLCARRGVGVWGADRHGHSWWEKEMTNRQCGWRSVGRGWRAGCMSAWMEMETWMGEFVVERHERK